jgi:hypothetical protein
VRKPRCAEAVPIGVDGHFTGYAACRKVAPCADHPKGKIDTIPNAVATQAKWKREERRKRGPARKLKP